MSDSPPRKHPIHTSIGKHEIRSVAVVDDAFDPVSLASIQEGEDKEFVDAINEEDSFLRAFHKLVDNRDSDDPIKKDSLTDDQVRLLWEKGRADATLGPVLKRTLFRVHEPKVAQVESLCTFLKDELKIDTIDRYGTASKIPEAKYEIVFVDYRFGPSREEESVNRAVRWATDLYKNGQAFIILMSSENEAFIGQEVFRRASRLTKGLFEFLDKAEIGDGGKFCNRLNSFCAGFDTRHEIHEFAAAAVVAVDAAADALKQSIHALGLEDYAYLEQISLREDGHPLGDYLLWLFGEYFGHNLSVSGPLQPVRRSINGLKYERFLPLQRPPSVMLAEMYRAAITEPVHEGWGPHPRDVEAVREMTTTPPTAPADSGVKEVGSGVAVTDALSTAEPGEVPPPPPTDQAQAGAPVAEAKEAAPSIKGMPLYQLGDLLVADEKKPAYLVLNAACDLQFSPDGKRDCDVLQSILLLPGQFEPLHERESDKGAKRTELFELGGKRYRIIWQHTRAVTHPYHEVERTYRPRGYERNWRLKQPYALEVQQHFASQLTRVGVPTPTPVFRERSVDVYGKNADGDYDYLDTIKSGLIVFHHRERDQFILTVDCVHAVIDQIDKYITQIEAELDKPSATPDVAGTAAPEDATATPPDPRGEVVRAVVEESAPDVPKASPKGEKKDKEKKVVVRDPAQEARKRAERRRKYVNELRGLRTILSHTCTFQDVLNDVPPQDGSIPQLEEIPQKEQKEQKPQTVVRFEIFHKSPLSGKYTSNAPLVLGFSLPDSHPTLPPEPAGSPVDKDAAPSEEPAEEKAPS